MTKTVLGLLCLLPSLALAAPQTLATQGVVRNASGDVVSVATDLTISLYDDAVATNPAVYTITVPDYPFVDGTYMVELPGVTQQMLSLSDLYVGVAVGGGDDLLPRTQMHSVPYALRANLAEELADAGCADGQLLAWNSATTSWACVDPAPAETDPVFAASDAAGITSSDIASWDTAASYGDHAGLYVPNSAPAAGITSGDIASWDASASYGDHAGLYLSANGGTISGTTIDIVPPADGQDAQITFSGGTGDAADWAWVSSGEELYLLEPEENNEVVITVDDDDFVRFSPNGVETMTMWADGTVSTPSLIEQTCPSGMQYFGGYCVENLGTTSVNPAAIYTNASATCATRGMMICPLRAYAACDLREVPGSCDYATDGLNAPVWTGDFDIGTDIFSRIVVYNSSGNAASTAASTASYAYLCCTPAYVR